MISKKKSADEVWAWMRKFATAAEKERWRPVALYVKDLEHRLADAERKLQPRLGASQSTITQALSNRSSTYVPLPKGGESLALRLSNMIKDGRQNSDEWKRTLKWNRLTEEQALDLVQNFKKG